MTSLWRDEACTNQDGAREGPAGSGSEGCRFVSSHLSRCYRP